MNFSDVKEKSKKIQKSIKDRTSSKTISEKWAEIKQWSLIASSISGAMLGGLTLIEGEPNWINVVLGLISSIAGGIAGRAQLNKGKQ